MCDNIMLLKVILFVKKLLDIVLLIVPIGLILMIALDFSKNVIANKEDEMRKNTGLVIKRLIYVVVLFLVPNIVEFAVNGVGNFGSEYIACLDVDENLIAKKIEEGKASCVGDNLEWSEITYKCEEKPPTNNSNPQKIYNYNISSDGGSGSSSGSKYSKNLTYYNQGNYSNVSFCYSGKTLSSSGCGATSLSIMTSTFSNSKYDPKYVGSWLCNNGHSNGALSASWFTNKKMLEHFNIEVVKLFDNAHYQSNAGKTYDVNQGYALLKAVQAGKGIVLYIPGHYVAVGSNEKCSTNEVYFYDVGRKSNLGCYTPEELFKVTYNYKDRCNNNGNCGWKAAWAYNGK